MTTAHEKPSDENSAPGLAIIYGRIIIQEHHHGEVNKYMWESSNIADHYSKVCKDFDNCEGEESRFGSAIDVNNSRP